MEREKGRKCWISESERQQRLDRTQVGNGKKRKRILYRAIIWIREREGPSVGYGKKER